MAKIIRLPGQHCTIVESIETILEHAAAGDIKSFVFAARTVGGNFVTSWNDGETDTNLGERQFLVSNLQADIFMAIVEANS